MPRLARRSAGSQVRLLAHALSNSLLLLEHDCFVRIEVVWRQAAADAARDLSARLRSLGPTAVLRDGVAVDVCMAATKTACEGANRQAAVLLDDAASMVHKTISMELSLCEQTLSARYAGIADVAVAAADGVQARVTAGATFGSRMDLLLFKAEQTFRDQMDTTKATGGGSAEILSRLFLETPNRLPNLSGRGVFWWGLGDAHAYAREVEFRMVEQIRLDAMTAFNDAGDARG